MLVTSLSAIQDTVVVVVRVWTQTDPTTGANSINLAPAGTACYVGQDVFVTAAHLFEGPRPGETILLISVPNNGSVAKVVHGAATVEVNLPDHDLAILRAPGVGSAIPAAAVCASDVPDGRSVFSYGYPNPEVAFTPNGPVFALLARACPSVVSAHTLPPECRYLLDGSTYPGESGAPVFRCADNALVAVVQATRVIKAPPHDVVRGPTVAGPLAPIAGELTGRGVSLLV
jgi:hypothetical protein